MAYSPTSISKQIKVFSSSDGFSFKIDKPGQTYRLLRGVLLAVIVITFVGNLIFILDAATNILSTDDTDYSAGPKHRGGVRPILPGIVEIDDEGERYQSVRNNIALFHEWTDKSSRRTNCVCKCIRQM